ncbi:nickel/cobalt transporter [Trichothermofontia sp.]
MRILSCSRRSVALMGLLLATTLGVSWQPAIAHPGHGAFTQTLVSQTLTPQFRLMGLGIAFLFGMAHAVSPGHGKTMVAAYLVGTRGTPKHAVLLGLITTLTHTLGIFLLGLAVLLAANYILPERLYLVLSFLIGLTVFGVGFWLLDQRLQELAHAPGHSPDPAHPDRAHAHAHPHALSDDTVTWRSLLALGISGSIVPCPSALVLLLSAISLGQVAYGMVLVSVFSLGLAGVLIGIGLLVIYAKQWVDHLPAGPRLGTIQRYLPLASAIAVMIVGVGLTLSSAL